MRRGVLKNSKETRNPARPRENTNHSTSKQKQQPQQPKLVSPIEKESKTTTPNIPTKIQVLKKANRSSHNNMSWIQIQMGERHNFYPDQKI